MKTKKGKAGPRLGALLLCLCMVTSLLAVSMPPVTVLAAAAADDKVIRNVEITDVNLNYKVGDAPSVTGKVSEDANYEIQWTGWALRVEGTITSSATWNSNGSATSLKQFEQGKTYTYIVSVQPKNGYTFPSDQSDLKITINGTEYKDIYTYNSSRYAALYGPTMTPTEATEPGDNVIKSVEITGATLSYNAGDTPQASASASDGCDVLYEGWTELDENGYGVAYWWSDGNYGSSETKFTQFEEGKTYIYEIGLTAAEGRTLLRPDEGLTVTLNGVTVASENVRAYSNDDHDYILQIIGPKMTPKKPIGQDYEITEGANGTWTQNSDGTLTFKANGDIDKFTEIKVDGNIVPKDMYTAESGSTVITLKNEYLATLSVGKHTLTVVYEDGEAATEFEIKAAEVDPPHTHTYGNWQSDAENHWKECSCGDKAEAGAHSFQWVVDKAATATEKGFKHEECKVCGYKRPAVEIPATGNGELHDVPRTGDNSSLNLWIVLLFASCAGAAGAAVYGRKKKEITK